MFSTTEDLKRGLATHAPESAAATWNMPVIHEPFPEGAPSFEFGLRLVKGRDAYSTGSFVSKFRNQELADHLARTDKRLNVAKGLIESGVLSPDGYVHLLQKHERHRQMLENRIRSTETSLTVDDCLSHPELRPLLERRGPELEDTLSPLRNTIAQEGFDGLLAKEIDDEFWRSAVLGQLELLFHQAYASNSSDLGAHAIVKAAIDVQHKAGRVADVPRELLAAAPELVEDYIVARMESGDIWRHVTEQLLNLLEGPPVGRFPNTTEAGFAVRWSNLRPLSLAEYEQVWLSDDQVRAGYAVPYVEPEVLLSGRAIPSRDFGRQYGALKDLETPALEILETADSPMIAFRTIETLWSGGTSYSPMEVHKIDRTGLADKLADVFNTARKRGEPVEYWFANMFSRAVEQGIAASLLESDAFLDVVMQMITSYDVRDHRFDMVFADELTGGVHTRLKDMVSTAPSWSDSQFETTAYNLTMTNRGCAPALVQELIAADPVRAIRWRHALHDGSSQTRQMTMEMGVSVAFLRGTLTVDAAVELLRATPEMEREGIKALLMRSMHPPQRVEFFTTEFMDARDAGEFSFDVIGKALKAALGDDVPKWNLTLELLPEWGGSVKDLLETVEATCS